MFKVCKKNPNVWRVGIRELEEKLQLLFILHFDKSFILYRYNRLHTFQSCTGMALAGMSAGQRMGALSRMSLQLALILAKCRLNSNPHPRDNRKSTRMRLSSWMNMHLKTS